MPSPPMRERARLIAPTYGICMTQKHAYTAQVEWTGNRGTGTSSYRAYDRSCQITAPGKAKIAASSDPAFRGDPARWNPEELLVASLATCHQLWYLHLCAEAGVIVHSYHDTAQGLMEELPDGSGQFLESPFTRQSRSAPTPTRKQPYACTPQPTANASSHVPSTSPSPAADHPMPRPLTASAAARIAPASCSIVTPDQGRQIA